MDNMSVLADGTKAHERIDTTGPRASAAGHSPEAERRVDKGDQNRENYLVKEGGHSDGPF